MRAVSLFHPFHSFDNSLSRLVNAANLPSGLHGAGLRVASSTQDSVGFAMDAVEYDDRYVVTANLPGLRKEQISIEVENDRVTVSTHSEPAAKPDPVQATTQEAPTPEATAARVLRKERYTGNFERSFVVTTPVAADLVSAKLELGVLELTLPKLAQKSSKKIVVA